jgi:hypothetical protein
MKCVAQMFSLQHVSSIQLRTALENIYVMGAVPARPTLEERKSIIAITALDDPKPKSSHTFAISAVEDLVESEEDASKTAAEKSSQESLLTINVNGRGPQFIV